MSWENMSWEKAAHMGAVLQVGLFVVSIYLVTRQLKKQKQLLQQQVKLTRVANTHGPVALASPFNLELARDENMAELWANGGKSRLNGVRESFYENMLIWWLVFYENIFVQEHN